MRIRHLATYHRSEIPLLTTKKNHNLATGDDALESGAETIPDLAPAPDYSALIPAHSEPLGDDSENNTSEQGSSAADLSHLPGTNNAVAPTAFAAFIADLVQQLQASGDPPSSDSTNQQS